MKALRALRFVASLSAHSFHGNVRIKVETGAPSVLYNM